MEISRRGFARMLLAGVPVCWGARAAGAEATGRAVRFLVLGDWGRMGAPDQRAVAAQMARVATESPVDFVMAVGDNFYENGVESVEDPHWKLSFEEVYGAASLQVPWHVILGNHDYHGDCEAQIAYGREHPRWVLPSRYYRRSLDFGKDSRADLFYIDTSPLIRGYRAESDKPGRAALRAHVLSQDAAAQLAWLEAELAASKAPWKIVAGHHPIYSGGKHGDQPELIEKLLPLLEKHGVRAYFCGHDHDLQHLESGGVHFFVSGGGAECRPTRETGRTLFARESTGFLAVGLSEEGMQVRVIDGAGRMLYRTEVPREVPRG